MRKGMNGLALQGQQAFGRDLPRGRSLLTSEALEVTWSKLSGMTASACQTLERIL
jgi:hypothetical protein